MAALMFLLAFVCFILKTFGGHLGSLDLIAFGLVFMAAGHLLGGGAITWIRKQIAD